MKCLGTITKIFAPWVALLSLIYTVNLSYTGYQQTIERDAVNRVFEFAKDYRTAMLSNQVLLNEKLRPVIETEVALIYADEALTDEQKIGKKDAAVRALVGSDKDTASAFTGMVIFYSNLSSCVGAGSCDCPVAQSMFASDVKSFRRLMFPVLESRKKKGGDTSLDLLDEFKDRTCESPPS